MSISSIIQSCKKPHNYLGCNEPIYLSNSVNNLVKPSVDTFTLVSFNIERGHKIDEAISLINNHKKLKHSDIILLQEMDNEGTKKIAKALNLNYVYVPINAEYGSNKDFGNGILTTGLIQDPEKLILPNGQIHNGRFRSACFATIKLGSFTLRIASTHLATAFMSTKKRFAQIKALEEQIHNDTITHDGYIIGGDFNAVTGSFRNKIINQFSNIGFDHSSAGLGMTHRSKIPFINPELDMIFSKSIQIINKGKIEDNSSSDHFPIWIDFTSPSQ